ncbi:ABC transporter substrate-binding protein [Paenibacillus agricola]|uniref:ABC transporter substrate-binding protein n=1 Tax=Paenibacillus agricola TaxID=2716264 RepID=A0ABX0J600_9BACL|nr:ABC transporter substrate-binding protein [Paenibacillus agricola]NHN31754.1 ABC transporter substrate-binding protein [Paenibacillus agricola]
MMRKNWIAMSLTVVFLISLVLSGCTDNKPATGADNSATKKGGTLKVAINGEPPTLDMNKNTSVVVQEISYHIFEGLFTFDDKYNAIPMLAKDYSYDAANKKYTINLRAGVKFHNGKILTADDVVASINRWGKVSTYGKTFLRYAQEVKKTGDLTIEILLKDPSPIIPMLLAVPAHGAGIFPEESIVAAGDGDIKEFIGTGPFRFVEHKADQYIKLARFDDYSALDGPAIGMGGKRAALVDELMFIPTPENSVRLDGVQTGQFDYAIQVNSDSYAQVKANTQVDSVIIKPYWWATAIFNKKMGAFKDQKLRQAFALALNMDPIMKAAFTNEEFYRLDPSILFKEQTEWWSDSGKEMYNQGNIEKAKQLMKEANYNGEKIRWMTTKDYDFMYKNAVVAVEQLKQIGFNIELQVSDWATIAQRRAKPEEWEVFSNGVSFIADPGIWAVWESSWPGWWESQKKDEMINKVNTEMDPKARKKKMDDLQAVFWEELPVSKFGDFFVLDVKSKKVNGFVPSAYHYFWNVSKN